MDGGTGISGAAVGVLVDVGCATAISGFTVGSNRAVSALMRASRSIRRDFRGPLIVRLRAPAIGADQPTARDSTLLKKLIPEVPRVAVLWNPGAFSEQTTVDMVSEATEAAKSLGLQLQYVEARRAEEFERAFSDAVNWHSDALFEFPNPTFYENQKRLVDLAAQHRLPAIYNAQEFVEVGGLIAYGANILELNRRTAIYVDKILKGSKPSDLPVEQPTTFDLAINLNTAKLLDLTVPPLLLAQADHIIE